MSELIVRASTEADVVRCAQIYGHHVLHGTASFEVDPPDLAEMKKRRAGVLDLGLPHLVAEREGLVMGYAYAGNWRPRPAYEFSVEDSIYVDKDAVGKGVGKALLPALIEECTKRGKHQMVAVIGDSAQTPSIRLHASCGFEMVGTLKNIGFKFGRWLDSVLMQRPLGPGDIAPPATRQPSRTAGVDQP
jgi:phosphinothricin acetyltransferase